jgi:hypothetical protein
MARRVGFTLGMLVVIIAGLAPSPASATGLHGVKTVTRTVTTQCAEVGSIRPPPPTIVDYTVTITVPRHVTSGSTFSIHFSAPYTLYAGTEAAGLATVSGGSLVTPDPGSLYAAAPAPSITGDITFTASGPPGSRILWRIGEFGEYTTFPVYITDFCTPVRPYIVARTPIV